MVDVSNFSAGKFGGSAPRALGETTAAAEAARQYKDPAFDPAGRELLKGVPVKMLKGAESNPRQSANPMRDSILASIREGGLMQLLRVTRVPGEKEFFTLFGSGNTRLACLQLLADEDPQKFGTTDVIFVPYNQTEAKKSALVENEFVGKMSAWDSAIATLELAENYFAGKKVTAIVAGLKDMGFRMTRLRYYGMKSMVDLFDGVNPDVRKYASLRSSESMDNFLRAARVILEHYKIAPKDSWFEKQKKLAVDEFVKFYDRTEDKRSAERGDLDDDEFMSTWFRKNFSRVTVKAAHDAAAGLVENSTLSHADKAAAARFLGQTLAKPNSGEARLMISNVPAKTETPKSPESVSNDTHGKTPPPTPATKKPPGFASEPKTSVPASPDPAAAPVAPPPPASPAPVMAAEAQESPIINAAQKLAAKVGLSPELVIEDESAPLGFLMEISTGGKELRLKQNKKQHKVWWLLHEVSRACSHKSEGPFPAKSPWKDLDDVDVGNAMTNLGFPADLKEFHFRILPSFDWEETMLYSELIRAIAERKMEALSGGTS